MARKAHSQTQTADGAPKKRAFLLRPGRAKRQQLEADLAHVNQEIYRRNLELDQTNKSLALLEAIDNLVLESDLPMRPLCTQLAKRVIEGTDYPFVAIMGYPEHPHGQLEMYGWATNSMVPQVDPEIIGKIALSTDWPWFNKSDLLNFMDLRPISDGVIAANSNSTEDEIRLLRQTFNVQTLCCIKLWVRKRLVGLMMIGAADHIKKPDTFTHQLFIRLGEAIGIAIDHKMLFEENQRVLQQLEDSNSKLKVLDRAKDEFISMASHQLRTPLTSVKGYISMVLEGDAGKINEPQNKLLTEAFLSAQRMVYLIGDFLNVSRLQTGKFVLEPKPTNLAEVVSEEISQLQATAARRNITIAYDQPANFPQLMLDDNKIRQVIMNFIDNAIFYSKQSSTVKVVLLHTANEIRLEVRDTGIGVPADERHHLFTKFYRAENARKVRPDGTGIGLFMAKKVIVAHGGTIIFETEENVGSTFGFRLPLTPVTRTR
jgi:signal transduction histidine kinase